MVHNNSKYFLTRIVLKKTFKQLIIVILVVHIINTLAIRRIIMFCFLSVSFFTLAIRRMLMSCFCRVSYQSAELPTGSVSQSVLSFCCQCASSPRRFVRFQPNLVRRTTDPMRIAGVHRIGVKGHLGVMRSNM